VHKWCLIMPDVFNYFACGRVRSIKISVYVCLSVCLPALAYLKNYISKFYEIFHKYFPWPWLSHSMTTVQYRLSTSGFVDVVMCSHNDANGPESKTTHMFRWVRQLAATGLKLLSTTPGLLVLVKSLRRALRTVVHGMNFVGVAIVVILYL